MRTKVLVAGVGNVLWGDDGFGSAVVRQLQAFGLTQGVEIGDYGTGGVHLAYDLLDGVQTLILVDAMSHGGSPGDVLVIEADLDDLDGEGLDAHAMDPATVMSSVTALGGKVPRTIVVGCEPETLAEGLGMSATVEAAVPVACAVIRDLIASELVQAAVAGPRPLGLPLVVRPRPLEVVHQPDNARSQ